MSDPNQLDLTEAAAVDEPDAQDVEASPPAGADPAEVEDLDEVDERIVRYAAYDAARRRYLGGVHPTKAAARAAAKARGVSKVEVREVD